MRYVKGRYVKMKNIRYNKRVVGLMVMILLLILTVGCTSKKIGNGNSKKNKEKITINEEFCDKEWFFYDEVRAENEVLRLGKDGSFSYHCSCGEPIGDSDIYETYEYDKNKKKIVLCGSEKETKNIELINYNEYHMLLKIDGEIKDFSLVEEDMSSNFFLFEGEKYLSGYDSRCSLVDIDEDKVTYGAIEYDPEGMYRDGPFEKYTLSKDVKLYELTIASYNSINDAEQLYEEFYEVSYDKIKKKDIKEYMENSSNYAYIWFDDELKIEKIVFFGQTTISADYEVVTLEPKDAKGITRKKLDEDIEDGKYDAAHIKEDGSVIYLMTKEQYKKYSK